MRLAEMNDGTERLSASYAAITQLTEEEQYYLACLAKGMSFQEMVVELGWTVEEVEDFGTKFFDRAFELRKGNIT